MAAAHVQQAAGRHLLLDQVEQAAGRFAPPRLLAQVGLVGHPPVEVGQLVAPRQPRLVDGAAVAARVEIAVLARVVVRRRHELRREAGGAAWMEQPERSLADVARLVGHRGGATHTTPWGEQGHVVLD